MKINGNDSGAHAAKKPSRERTAPKKQKTARRRMGRAARMATVIVCCVLALACAVAAWYMLWEKPPERPTTGLNTLPPATEKPAATAAPSATPEPTEDPNAGAPASLNENMYTFLVVGLDKVAYHTDTIMVGRFDVETHEINVVSIPRDTLMNITGSTKKINELYLRGVNSGEGGVTRLLAGIKDMIGFDVDVYAVVDLQAFVELVNAVGGVDYDVPVDMHYYDPTQDLVIDLDAGMQHLTGEQAIGVMRFRSGYASADIGRIGTQQDFLMSVASQFLSLGSIPRLGEFIDIFNEYVETNMTAENLAFFARQFLMCSSEDIHFYTNVRRVDFVLRLRLRQRLAGDDKQLSQPLRRAGDGFQRQPALALVLGLLRHGGLCGGRGGLLHRPEALPFALAQPRAHGERAAGRQRLARRGRRYRGERAARRKHRSRGGEPRGRVGRGGNAAGGAVRGPGICICG